VSGIPLVLLCLGIELPMAFMGMLMVPQKPCAVAAVIDVITMVVITRLPRSPQSAAQWQTFPKNLPGGSVSQQASGISQEFAWAGRNLAVHQYVMGGIALAAPFIMCWFFSLRHPEGW